MAHEHSLHQHTAPARITKALIAGIILNSAFVIIEGIAGLLTHSLALLADAGHNLSDVASLALALLANKLALKKANSQFSFGYRQSTVLVALVNGGILLFAMGAIAYEAVLSFMHPHAIAGGTVALVAGIGIVINSATALLFFKDKESDINVKGAYLHMAADALVSLGVVISGLVIVYTGWLWLDPAVSLVVVLVIVAGTWGLLKESLRLTLNGVPKNIDLKAVNAYFTALPGVKNVHDLHVWAISTTETALTVHLVVPGNTQHDALYETIKEGMHHHFNISHTTVQVEADERQFTCGQKSDAYKH